MKNTSDYSTPYFAEDNKEKIDYFVALGLKQYEVYNACMDKVNTLTTVCAIFIGAAVLFIDFEKIMNQAFCVMIINVILIFFLILSFVICLFILIWHISPTKLIIPKMKDKISNNHRAVYGIKQHRNLQNYKNRISKLMVNEVCDEIITQVYLLNDIMWRIQKKIRAAERISLIGLVIFLLFLSCQAIFDNSAILKVIGIR